MKKQSSVEWFQEQINKICYGTSELSLTQIFEQAKSMHKEEIVDAYVYGAAYQIDEKNGLGPGLYYKEKFEK